MIGSYYVQALSADRTIALLSVGPGALAAAILVVNNHRDRAEDARTGKRTLAVRWGERGSRWEYVLLLVIAFGVPAAMPELGWWRLLPLAVAPAAIDLVRQMTGDVRGEELNRTLAGTARLCLGVLRGIVRRAGSGPPIVVPCSHARRQT